MHLGTLRQLQVSWFTVVTWTTALLEACRWAVPVFGASAQQIPNCESNFKETTVTVHWKDYSITGTRVSRLLP